MEHGWPAGGPSQCRAPLSSESSPSGPGDGAVPGACEDVHSGRGLAGQELAGRRSSTAGAHMATTLGPCRHHTRHEPLPLSTGFVPHTGPASYGPFASLRS